jgi:hypothetical protein
MATQRTSFAKLQRDRDKQAKAAAKRARRQERDTTSPPAEAPALLLDGESELNAAQLLELVETVHRQFEAGTIDFDTFEEAKAAILSRLPVD